MTKAHIIALGQPQYSYQPSQDTNYPPPPPQAPPSSGSPHDAQRGSPYAQPPGFAPPGGPLQAQMQQMPGGAPPVGQFVGASATADDVGTFNGGSFRISHRDTNTIVTLQLAMGCPITAKPGSFSQLSYLDSFWKRIKAKTGPQRGLAQEKKKKRQRVVN